VSSAASEPIIDAELAIVDPHHHLWLRPAPLIASLERDQGLMTRALMPAFRRHARYLLDEFLEDLRSGHNVRATVYVEVHSMYRQNGPEAMRSVGEVEFANGVAAMADSGAFGEIAVCAGIVGSVDLRLGDAAKDVMLAHMQAGGGRYRGIRTQAVVFDPDPAALGPISQGVPHLMLDDKFREGFRHLAPLGLSFEAWQLEYQLAELIDLAQAFPHTQIIVNHLGGLFGLGSHSGKLDERFRSWRENIAALARCPNVAMKLGGLGMPICALPSSFSKTAPTSVELARDWKPYIECCIQAFGVERCMFESNFPVDAATTSYAVLWNAFKRIVSGASADEKAALFSATARRIYKLN
jgi:L-fuconolactonase